MHVRFLHHLLPRYLVHGRRHRRRFLLDSLDDDYLRAFRYWGEEVEGAVGETGGGTDEDYYGYNEFR